MGPLFGRFIGDWIELAGSNDSYGRKHRFNINSRNIKCYNITKPDSYGATINTLETGYAAGG